MPLPAPAAESAVRAAHSNRLPCLPVRFFRENSIVMRRLYEKAISNGRHISLDTNYLQFAGICKGPESSFTAVSTSRRGGCRALNAKRAAYMSSLGRASLHRRCPPPFACRPSVPRRPARPLAPVPRSAPTRTSRGWRTEASACGPWASPAPRP